MDFKVQDEYYISGQEELAELWEKGFLHWPSLSAGGLKFSRFSTKLFFFF